MLDDAELVAASSAAGLLSKNNAARLREVDGPAPHDIDVMVVGPDVDSV